MPLSLLRPCLAAVLSLFLMPLANADSRTSASASDQIASARDKVLPVVVSIIAVRQDYRQGEPSLSVASGSGTVISADGHVATNAHVVHNGKSFRVVFSDGRELPATLIGTDTLSDLAVLKVVAAIPEKFAFAQFASQNTLKPGDTVLAMGAPWGLSNSMSAGVVNNPRRLLVSLFDDETEYEDSLGDDVPTGRYYAWIQHDASIAPGNSGGPLVDLSGQIVGVNTRGMIMGGDLAFAIPGPDAGNVVNALITHGRVNRVWLGFRLRSLKGTGLSEGVLISTVERDSAAERAGLRAGDLILSLNGEPVTALQPIDVPSLQKHIAELSQDSTVIIGVNRDGKSQHFKLQATAEVRERGREAAVAEIGISASELTQAMGKRRNLSTSSGILITGIRPGGPAAVARPAISEGDVITRINGREVQRLSELQALASSLRDGQSLVVEIESDGLQQLSVLKPVRGDRGHEPLPELPKSWVGVQVQPFTASLARDAGLSSAGYRIARIFPGSPLLKAGARVGDLLVAIDGEPMRPLNEESDDGFGQRVRDLEPQAKVSIDALRDGKALKFDIVLSSAPIETSGLRTLAVNRLRAQLRELGFYDRVAMKLPVDRAGVFIDGVESGGAAGLAHLQRGDIVTRLANSVTNTPLELSEALERALVIPSLSLIPLQIIRGGQTRILYLERYWLNADTVPTR